MYTVYKCRKIKTFKSFGRIPTGKEIYAAFLHFQYLDGKIFKQLVFKKSVF